jgi:transcription initiation factor TFIID TATA-box-binding protein
MRKRKYIPLDTDRAWDDAGDEFPVPVCHNIVSTSQIECTNKWINLQRVSLLLPNSRYDRKRFAAITIRIANPTCTGLLFSSGKLVITGSVSMYACMLAAHTISRLLRESDTSQDFRIISCVVQNIVAHAEVPKGKRVDVDQFYRAYCVHATYQKNVFPGLVFRPPESPIVLLIFASGKIVCTGGKSCEDIQNGFRRLYPLIQPFIVNANCIRNGGPAVATPEPPPPQQTGFEASDDELEDAEPKRTQKKAKTVLQDADVLTAVLGGEELAYAEAARSGP